MADKPWRGATVVCIASGPSLTMEDVEMVRQWRQQEGAQDMRRVVVANTSFRAAPWADALFAMDRKWWEIHHIEVAATFKGQPLTTAPVPINWAVRRVPRTVSDFRNSGAGCISLAVSWGASKVLMLGYDCSHGADGATHWHGSHPAGLGDAASVKRWPAKFKLLSLAMRAQGARVINCSRHTLVDSFERGDINELLQGA